MTINGNELHVVEYRDKFIVYRPISASIVLVNVDGLALLRKACSSTSDSIQTFSEHPDFVKLLETYKIVSNNDVGTFDSSAQFSFAPTSVSLFPSHNCNLRCVYCYGSAESNDSVMDYKVAVDAIDFVVRNALAQGLTKIKLSFGGGGEPFFGAGGKLMQDVVSYTRSRCKQLSLECDLFVATNGVLSSKQRAWIKDNNVQVQISIDGPDSIHNLNRPLSNGDPSLAYVRRTVDYFENNHIAYSIRATITKDSAPRMGEIIDFISSISSVKKLHVEPMANVGRGATSGAEGPDLVQFGKHFAEASKFARTKGWKLNFSKSEIALREHYCGALEPNFCVTPDGYVTSCYEVTKASDERSTTFFFGRHDPSKPNRFYFDEARITFLRNRVPANMPGCRDCIASATCAGDCPAKMGGGIYDPSSFDHRCELTREMVVQNLMLCAEQLEEEQDHVAV